MSAVHIRIHKCRRTSTTWEAGAGKELLSPQRLLGGRRLELVNKYAIQTDGDLRLAHAEGHSLANTE